MSTLEILQNGEATKVTFAAPTLLQTLLNEHGFLETQPCGGRGVCGKCRVELSGLVSPPNKAELKAGTRLSCQAVLLGDAQVTLAPTVKNKIEISTPKILPTLPLADGICAAVDIGTTTIAVKLYRTTDGAELSSAAELNPQCSIAADVMGRIGAALNSSSKLLKNLVCGAIDRLLKAACASAEIEAEAVSFAVITGNTTMLYLLTGRNVECLSCAPFNADHLFGEKTELAGRTVYYPPCINAFVGADIICAVLAAEMHLKSEISLLCDIGTNGELALWKNGKLYVTSTAAGPAFEGAGISFGCGSIDGAIDRVWIENGEIRAHTINDKKAVGICGSGLIDAIAVFLKTEQIDETGATEKKFLQLRDGVGITGQDIRAVQLAKAAIAAGIKTLLEFAGADLNEVSALYIAGGFGTHLNVRSAGEIGLIPSTLANKARVLGNGALTGAAKIIMNKNLLETAQQLSSCSVHLNLGGNPTFNRNYMEEMLFGECDAQ